MKAQSRRRFLKHAGVLGAGAVVAACAPAQPSAPAQPAEPVQPAEPTEPSAPEPEPTSPPPAAEVVSIRWGFWGNEALNKVYDASLDLFHAQNENIKVEKVYVEGGTGPYTEKLLAMIAANDVPDVLLTTPDHLNTWGSQGLLADLAPFMASDKLDTADFFQAGIEGAKRMNVQIGLPVGVFVSPLYYNKKHLAEVEIEAPTSPDWTWDDLVAMAHKLTRQVDGQQRWGFHISSWFDLLIAPRVWANGGEVLNSDDTICLLDQPKAMGAIQWWYDLRNKEQVAPDPSQMASIKELGAFYFAFMAGMVSMGSEGTWCPAGFNSTPDLEWDMQVWPIPAGGKQAGVLGQDNISVTTRTSNAQPAWEWASFLTDKEAQQLRAEGGFWCPVRKSVAQDPKAQAGLGTGINYQGVFMELDTARPVCSNAVRWPEISDLLTPALDLIFGGQQAVDVLPPVVQQINDKLSKPPVE